MLGSGSQNVKELKKLTLLSTLNLSENGLEFLSPEIGSLRNLHALYITDNSLTSLPSTFSNLASLRFIKHHGNRFDGEPPVLAALAESFGHAIDGM
jgi:Leucine-rich repeat (LRR) protein